ncbi:MAG: polysaccharide biosynthesis C-terminal domain-containing protein [Cytophagales bacterium]|nr:polysaccharide biosynthesis C-terminal domain-containing protein [Cytophaga sp.]
MNKKILGMTFFVRVVMALSTIGIFILSSRYLGAQGRGTISLFIANRTIVQLISEIIFGSGYIYFIHHYSKRSIITYGFMLSVLAGFAIPYLLYFLNLQPERLLSDLVLNSILFAWMNWVGLHLRAHKQFGLYNAYYLISSILQIGIIWSIMDVMPSVSNYILGLQLHLLICFISGLIIVLFNISNYTTHQTESIRFISLLKKSFSSQYSTWLNFLNTRLSYYLIYIFFSNNQLLGIYSAASTFTEVIWIIPYALATPLYPIISSETNTDKKIHFTNEYAYASFWLSFIGIAILLCIPEYMLEYVIGKDFKGIRTFIFILGPGTIILSYSKIYWNYFQGNGLFHINTKAALMSSVAPVIVFLPLVTYTSIYGIAYMTCASYITYSFLLLYYYQKETNTHWNSLLVPKFRLFPRSY